MTMSMTRLGAILALAGTAAAAEPIVFEADEGILVVRGVDTGPDARFEFIANGDGRIQCVALGRDGQPVAAETSFANMGFIRFSGISVAVIDRVACRRL